jgi:hypothetical protein
MPHFKCVACKIRTYGPGSQPGRVADVCPQCGELLEPVGELAEIVGFQEIQPRARENLDAGCWIDYGESQAEAVALPRPEKES